MLIIPNIFLQQTYLAWASILRVCVAICIYLELVLVTLGDQVKNGTFGHLSVVNETILIVGKAVWTRTYTCTKALSISIFTFFIKFCMICFSQSLLLTKQLELELDKVVVVLVVVRAMPTHKIHTTCRILFNFSRLGVLLETSWLLAVLVSVNWLVCFESWL